MNKKLFISLALLAILTFSANAQTSVNGKWKLISIKEGFPLGHTITLNIDGAKIGGNGGCNSFGGNFRRKGGKVKFSQIISTKMWCDDHGKTEIEYFEILGKTVYLQSKNGQLIMLNSKREVLLRFKKNN